LYATEKQQTESLILQSAALAALAKKEAQNAALQAKIDELMLEYCPEEMPEKQVEEWGKNQVSFEDPLVAEKNATIQKQSTEILELQTALETERMRLAACGVAAMMNTRDCAKKRIHRNSPYWSESYADVCRAIDSQMDLREAEQRLSQAYLRIREKVGSFDTPAAPAAEEVYAHTENKLDSIIGHLRTLEKAIADSHNLYKSSDMNVPEAIKDRNGEIVLKLCKDCGRAEAELSVPCDKRNVIESVIDFAESCTSLLGDVSGNIHWCTVRCDDLEAEITDAIDSYKALKCKYKGVTNGTYEKP
jgi:hypothetical protein